MSEAHGSPSLQEGIETCIRNANMVGAARCRLLDVDDHGESAIVSVDQSATLEQLAELLIELKSSYEVRSYHDFEGKLAVKLLRHGVLDLVVEPIPEDDA